MKTLSKILIATLGVMLTHATVAEKPESTMFYMSTENRYYKAKFVMASNLVVLPFQINKTDSLNFIFDTGVDRTIITELNNPTTISNHQKRKVKVRGLGSAESIVAELSENNHLSIGDILAEKQEILVIPNNTIDLSSSLGHKVNGVVGRTFFEQFVVEINYINKTVKFHNPDQFNRKIRKGDDVIPIELINGKPYVNAMVTINGEEIPVKLLFDTGMSFSLWLDPTTNRALKPAGLSIHDDFGHGLNGEVSGEISRVEKFQIGKFVFTDVITAFPDSNDLGSVAGSTYRNGSVGADIFRRFNVVIDYQSRQIILRKNQDYKQSFEYDMSGIEVSPILPGLPFYYIVSVKENSPASECGLMVNDEIVSLNGKPAKELSMSQIVDILRQRESNRIRITVKRNGELVKVDFRLRRLV